MNHVPGLASWLILALFLSAPAARADLPSPRFDLLTPLGAAAGSTVEVSVAGADLEEAITLIFDHPGITAEHLKDRKFKVTIAATVPAGTYDARLVGKYGITNPRLFAVSTGLTEVAEKGPNAETATVQHVPVNSVINGSSDQGREDVFRFSVKKGQRIVLECFAQRLDSQLDASLALTAVDGKLLASNGDTFGRDPFLEFIAPAESEYLIIINDLSFRGGFPYRLVITDHPHIENIFPRVVPPGKVVTLTTLGRNLGKDAKLAPFTLNDLPLQQQVETITAPEEIVTRGQFRFTNHPTGHSVLPTAATSTLVGFQHHGVPLLVSDGPLSVEHEPNNDAQHPQVLTIPAVVSGRFDRERDADWFEFEAPESGNYQFEVYCERIAGHADPYVVVRNDQDARITELDDFGIRMNAFDGHIRDVSGSVNLNAKKKYRVLVQDRYRRGGARYQYVLTIRKAAPDFFPVVIHHQNPGPGGTTVRKGGAVALDIVIHTIGGLNDMVTIRAEGLPKGLHAADTIINNDNRGTFVLWADADSPDWVGPIKLIATARNGNHVLTREVRPYTRVWQSGSENSSRPTRELVIAVRDRTPFALMPTIDQLTLRAGEKATVKVKCERLWPELKSSVNLVPLAFPGPIKMSNVTIAEGQNEAAVTFDVQAHARPGRYTIALVGQAQVPFSKDSKATTKPNTLVPVPSRPLTITVQPVKK